MDKRMLINASDAEECRIAIVEENKLVDLEIESLTGKKLKGNIYKAKVARVEPSLQAAFVDIGAERNAFLQISDVHPSYFKNSNSRSKPPIQDVLETGQEIVVQVVKEERDLKGATLTTYLSLPGRYLVVLPGSDRSGVSKKIHELEHRKRLKRLHEELEIPVGIGVIIRTSGMDRSIEDLSRDLSFQLRLWERIIGGTQSQDSVYPKLLYQESDLPTRVVRDYFTPDIREIIIDETETYNRVKDFVGQLMPRYKSRVKLYDGHAPLYTANKIEEQVMQTMEHSVGLPSGGSIVIQQVEALVAIDVNSGKATTGEDIEDTAYHTNLEAADEIARQLRLRDLGGLVIIDFIDMINKKHRAQIERAIKDAVEKDKARIEIGQISKFGLLELSRQRMHASLASQSYAACGNCQGSGRIKQIEIIALQVLRKIQGAVLIGGVKEVKARLYPAVAYYLLNHKKKQFIELETLAPGVDLQLLPDNRMRQDEYEFEMGRR